MERWSIPVLRVALATVFGFFGILAIMNPAQQTLVWMPPWAESLVIRLMPTATFIFLFGVVEVVLAAALVTGFFVRYAALVAIVILFPIIISTFPTDIAFRDIAIAGSALSLFLATGRKT